MVCKLSLLFWKKSYLILFFQQIEKFPIPKVPKKQLHWENLGDEEEINNPDCPEQELHDEQ